MAGRGSRVAACSVVNDFGLFAEDSPLLFVLLLLLYDFKAGFKSPESKLIPLPAAAAVFRAPTPLTAREGMLTRPGTRVIEPRASALPPPAPLRDLTRVTTSGFGCSSCFISVSRMCRGSLRAMVPIMPPPPPASWRLFSRASSSKRLTRTGA